MVGSFVENFSVFNMSWALNLISVKNNLKIKTSLVVVSTPGDSFGKMGDSGTDARNYMR